jgi:hypothetical protein
MWQGWGTEEEQRVFVGKPIKSISLGRPRCRWKHNIKINLKKVGWGKWTGLLWLRIRDRWWALVNVAMNLRVPYTARNFLTS